MIQSSNHDATQRFTGLFGLSTSTIQSPKILSRFQSSLSATTSLTYARTFGLICVFFLLRSNFMPTETSLRQRFPTLILPTSRYFPPVIWTCVRTFVRVHYKHVHRKGMSRRNIDVLLKLNRIDDKNDDVRCASISSHTLCSPVSLLMPPRCTIIPTCTEMRVRANLSSLLPRFLLRSQR